MLYAVVSRGMEWMFGVVIEVDAIPWERVDASSPSLSSVPCAVLSNSANNGVAMDDQRRAEVAGSPVRH